MLKSMEQDGVDVIESGLLILSNVFEHNLPLLMQSLVYPEVMSASW